ncbi:SAM-dependent methyltransferase, partial [Azoarcus taiwanensis]|nr:SAM-dependent methyltransferase [Azoarcus taiwanensis]
MSYANSRIPVSAQQGVHEQLEHRVRRHLEQAFRKPCAPHNVEAFEACLETWYR